MRFRQKGHRTFELGKQEMAYFTWASLVDDRIVELECGDWKGEDKLMMNRLVDVKYNKDSRKYVLEREPVMGEPLLGCTT